MSRDAIAGTSGGGYREGQPDTEVPPITVLAVATAAPARHTESGPVGFSLDFSRRGRFVVVEVSGALDRRSAPLLRERLVDVIVDQGNLSVIIELGGVSSIDRDGVSVIVSVRQQLRDRGGVLVLRGPSRPH